jgi:hypothetical protein
MLSEIKWIQMFGHWKINRFVLLREMVFPSLEEGEVKGKAGLTNVNFWFHYASDVRLAPSDQAGEGVRPPGNRDCVVSFAISESDGTVLQAVSKAKIKW